MGLFGKKKTCCCGCGGQTEAREEAYRVKVLGSGCAKCNALEEAVRAAQAELGQEPGVGHVTDPARIAAYGVMTTPALVIDGRVVSYGRVLKKEEVKALLQSGQ